MTGASSKSLVLGLGVGLWSGPSGKLGSFFFLRQRKNNQHASIEMATTTIPATMPAMAPVGRLEEDFEACDSKDTLADRVVDSANVVVVAALLIIVTVAGGTGSGEDTGVVDTTEVDEDVASTDALFTDVVFEGVFPSEAPHMYGPQTSGYPTASQYSATDF